MKPLPSVVVVCARHTHTSARKREVTARGAMVGFWCVGFWWSFGGLLRVLHGSLPVRGRQKERERRPSSFPASAEDGLCREPAGSPRPVCQSNPYAWSGQESTGATSVSRALTSPPSTTAHGASHARLKARPAWRHTVRQRGGVVHGRMALRAAESTPPAQRYDAPVVSVRTRRRKAVR